MTLTDMKRTRLLPLFLLLALLLLPLRTDAQVGPGGVGNITNTQLWLRSDSLIAIQPLVFCNQLAGPLRSRTRFCPGPHGTDRPFTYTECR